MKSILILEDDENLRELLQDVLDSLDYRVEAVGTPQEAIHVAQEIAFEVIITDIRMAGPMDGLGCLAELKKLRPSLRSIVMTGFADETAPLRAIKIAVDDYLYKPFDVKDVLAALERVKKAAAANQWHRRILAKLMGQLSPEERLEQLSSLREEGLAAFFVAVRSQLLYAETALESWDQWEELDSSYLQVLRNPMPSAIDSLANRIREWTSRLNQRASAQTFVSAPMRSSQRVERSSFRNFLEKIKSGAISAADLSLAVSLRRLPPERRPADLQELWQTMWGSL